MSKIRIEVLDRREFLVVSGAAVAALTALTTGALAREAKDPAKLLNELTGGATPTEGKVSLKMPEIAENGATVPVKVSADTPQNEGDNCKTIAIIATKNPRPRMCVFHFTPRSGKAFAAIRVRLATTQEVWAVAEMSDGSWHIAKTTVKVTIGGCGG
jgi:sulfur-oxidizing protein SoxY